MRVGVVTSETSRQVADKVIRGFMLRYSPYVELLKTAYPGMVSDIPSVNHVFMDLKSVMNSF